MRQEKTRSFDLQLSSLLVLLGVFLATTLAAGIGNQSVNYIGFNQSSYKADVSSFYSREGDYLATVGISYDDTIVKNATVISFSIFGENTNAVRIRNDGDVFLSKPIRDAGIRSVTIGAFVEALLFNGETVITNINAELKIDAKGLLYFQPHFLHINISHGLPVEHFAYNLSQHLVSNFKKLENYELIFFSEASDYFVSSHDGILTLKPGEGLGIGSYDVVVWCSYDVLANGTFVVDKLSLLVRLSVLGCKGGIKGLLEWPTLSPCQMVQQPCSQLTSLLDGGDITQHCSYYGDWAEPDFSQCHISNELGSGVASRSFIVAWFTFSESTPKDYNTILQELRDMANSTFSEEFAVNVSLLTESSFGPRIVILVQLLKTVNDSKLKLIHQHISSLTTLGSINLARAKGSQGFRTFIPSVGCNEYRYSLEGPPHSIPICMKTSNSSCNCTKVTTAPDPSCDVEDLVIPEYLVPSQHLNDAQANFHFSQKSYERTVYVGDAKVGMELVTVKLNITNNDSLRSHSAHYGIHGYGSRLFQIGHSSGIVTLKKKFQGTTHRYSFEVTCYFTATFKNGTVLYSSLETTVLINFDNGITFNQSAYFMAVDSGIPHNAEIINISKFVVLRQGVFSNLQLHFYVSEFTIYPLENTENTFFPFKLSSNGLLLSYTELKPLVEFTMLVSLDVVGSDMRGQRVVVNTAAKFFIRIRGCPSVEDGIIAWPSTHPCGVAVIKCSEFDQQSFNNQGVIRRQCSRGGRWLAPDFSNCTFHSYAKPFIITWVSFYTTQIWSIEDTFTTLRNLRRFLVGYPLESIAVHGTKTLNRNSVRGTVQSFRAVLKEDGPFNDSQLQQLKDNIKSTNYIGGKLIHDFHGSYGVMGFLPVGICMNDQQTSDLHYQYICRSSDGVVCKCHYFKPAPCCTSGGVVSHNQTCPQKSHTSKAEDPTIVEDLQVQLKCSVEVGSRHAFLKWDVQGNVEVEKFVITYILFGVFQENSIVNGSTSLRAINITGLFPGSAYQMTVSGEVHRNGSKTTATCTRNVYTLNDYPVVAFQLLLQTNVICSNWTKDKLQILNEISYLISRMCGCQFSTHKFGQVFAQCQRLDSESHITLSSWIYRENEDSSYQYREILERMSTRSIAFAVNSHEYVVRSTCFADIRSPIRIPCVPIAKTVDQGKGSTREDEGVSVTVVILVPVFLCILTFILATSFNCILHKLCFKDKRRYSSKTTPKPCDNQVSNVLEDECALEHEF